METTTAYRPGQGSVAESSAAYAEAVRLGKVKDSRLLYDHVQAERDLVELQDDGELIAELRRSYVGREWVDYGRIVRDLRDPETDHSDGTRYFLNRSSVSSDQWVDPKEFDERADKEKRIEKGSQITLGLDGSWNDDHTVLVACDVASGHIWPLDHWIPDPLIEDWTLPLGEVDGAVRSAFARYDVALLYADPPFLQGLLSAWAEDFGPKKIIAWWTNRDIPMAAALARLHTAIVSEGSEFSHSGDTLLTTHFRNARKLKKKARSADPDGKHERILIRKPTPRGHDKIDGAVSATLAYEARADFIGSGKRKKRKSRAAGF